MTELKIENLIKGLLIISLAVGLSYQAQASRTDTKKSIRVATLKAPDGSRLKLMSHEVNNLLEAGLQLPGVRLSSAKDLCTAKTTSGELRQLETQLELSFLIEHIKDAGNFTGFNPSQKQTLAQVPVCEPYLLDLAVLSKLTEGYQLVKVEKKYLQ